jgi:lipopolysaccharide export system permease protein
VRKVSNLKSLISNPILKTLDWYIIRKYFGTFLLSISLIILIVIIFDVSEKIDDFLESKAPLREIIFSYYLNFIPYFVNLFSALFAFISVIFFTAKMASNTEIVAILSGGISFRRLLLPYLIVAAVLAGMSFYLANFLIPYANIKRLAFENRYIKEPSKLRARDIHFQIKPAGTFVYCQSFIDISKTGYKFSIEKIGSKGLYYKLNADYIQFDTLKRKWKIMNYYIRTITGMKETIKSGREIDTVLNLKPADLIPKLIDVDVMNFTQLRKFIDDQKLKGSENIHIYQVAKHKRVASPFATIVLTIIGVALSSRKIRGGVGLHIGVGIAISFAYILFMQVSTTFANFGNLTPIIAVWLPNIIFLILGLYLVRIAPK